MPQNGGGKPDTWLAGHPAGKILKTNMPPCVNPPPTPGRFFHFSKVGRPGGQPTMYPDSPIHVMGILLVLVYYRMYSRFIRDIFRMIAYISYYPGILAGT